MSFIELMTGERVEPEVIDVVADYLTEFFGLPVRQAERLGVPEDSYDPGRDQYSSTAILRHLVARPPGAALRVLGITERDIFIPMLNFIFGQAQLGGRVALISLARLRQEFYGLPPDPELLLDRACKEAAHELGHTFGLTHCSDPHCTMSLSVSVEQVDGKEADYCPGCRSLLRDALGACNAARTAADEDSEEEA